MARPQKQGLDYFPFDCVSDGKTELIEAEYGLQGFAIIVKLLQMIYGQRGYYCEWNAEVALLFAHKNNVGGNVVSETIKSALRRGIFNEDLFAKYGILTSAEIQKTYFEAVERRKQIEVKKEYLLIKVTHKNVNVDINPINDNINSINADNNSQSKVKESKVNKSKEKDNSLLIGLLLKDGEIFYISDNEISDYQKRFPCLRIRQELVSMKNWLEEKPEARRSLSGTRKLIESWLYKKAKGVTDNGSAKRRVKEVEYPGYDGGIVL